jgi:hypothetical protein
MSGKGSTRLFVYGKWRNHIIEVDVLGNELLDNISLNGRSRHSDDGGFGGYHIAFGFHDNEDIYGKKEYPHGNYTGRVGKRYETGEGLPIGKKVRLKLEVKDTTDNTVSVKGWYDKYDGKGYQLAVEYEDKGDLYEADDIDAKDLALLKSKKLTPEQVKRPFLQDGNMIWIRCNHHEEDDPIRIQNPRIKDIILSNIAVREI